MPRPFLIDTDTASDDAVALIMALRHPDVTVRAITLVNGNVPLQQGLKNAAYTAQLCHRADVPLHAGGDRPLARDPFDACYFHGCDGLGDQGFTPAPFTVHPTPAPDAILHHARELKGDLTLVTLGPLTNIARALQLDPTTMRSIQRTVIMGGAPCCVGNVTPAAEYNIWCDPEAASIVFRSGMNLEMVGWHLSRHHYALDAADIAQIRALNTPLAHFTIDCNATAAKAFEQQTGQPGIALPDPVAMAVALDPTIVTSASAHLVEIETTSDLTRGMTVVDQLNLKLGNAQTHLWPATSRPAKIIWDLDAMRWKAQLRDALK